MTGRKVMVPTVVRPAPIVDGLSAAIPGLVDPAAPYMLADMSTDSRRKAVATYHAKLAEEGVKRVTFWLSAEAQATLDRLTPRYGSKVGAVEAALALLDRDGRNNLPRT